MDELNKYKVYIRSKPGMYEQYSMCVRVDAYNDEDAIDQALLKLKRGAFPDRTRDMWRVEKVERLV